MGANASFVLENAPQNDFTIAGRLFRQCGVKYVCVQFQDLLQSEDIHNDVYHHQLYISTLTDLDRQRQITQLTQKISPTMADLMVAFLQNGIRIVVNGRDSQFNGEVFENKVTKQRGFVHQGREVMNAVLVKYFHAGILNYVECVEEPNMLQVIKQLRSHEVKPVEILAIHHNADVIRKHRNAGGLAILLDDQKLGFRLT